MNRPGLRSGVPLEVATLVLLCGLLFFFRLGISPLWEIDEGMHAAMAAEMARSGDWLTPRFNGEPFFDKPVLFTWLGAAFLRVFGETELASRLPVAFLGLGTVLVTYVFGRKVYGGRAGFFSGVVLATALMFLVLSRVVVHDMCLVFFLTLALTLFFVAIHEERHRKTYLAFAWAAIGCAVLTKGPLGLVLPAGVALVFLLLVWNPGSILKSRIGTGILIVLAVAGPWYLLMHREHPDYLEYFLVRQHLGNFVEGQQRHVEPAWFYAPVVLGGFFPWTCFLPAALFGLRPGRNTTATRATVFAWAWVLVPLVLFSTAASKLPTYALPMLPPLALLVGAAWAKYTESSTAGGRRWFVACSAALALVGLAALVFTLVTPPVRLQEKYGIDLTHVTLAGVIMAVGFTGSLGLQLRRLRGPAFGAIAGTVAVLFLWMSYAILPRIDPYRSTKELVLALDAALPPGEELVFVEAIVGVADSALFYTDRPARVLATWNEVTPYLNSPERVFLLSKREPLSRLASTDSPKFVLKTAGKRILISNQDGPLPGGVSP